jgi:hypothetical protein
MTRGAARGLAAAFAAVVCALPAWAAEVTEIRVGTHPTFTRVVFQLDAPAGYRIEKVTAEDGVPEIRVTLEAGATPRSLEAKSEMVERVALQDGRERSLAHIRLRHKPSRIKELILTDPPRIVFDLVYPEAKLAEIARREEAAKARAAEVAAAKAAAAAPKPESKPEVQAKVEPPKPAPAAEPAPKPLPKPEKPAAEPKPAPVAKPPEPVKPEVQAKVEPPKPTPAVEPSPKPVPKPETAVKPPEPKAAPEPKLEAKAEAKPEPKPEAKPEPKPEPKLEAKAEAKPPIAPMPTVMPRKPDAAKPAPALPETKPETAAAPEAKPQGDLPPVVAIQPDSANLVEGDLAPGVAPDSEAKPGAELAGPAEKPPEIAKPEPPKPAPKPAAPAPTQAARPAPSGPGVDWMTWGGAAAGVIAVLLLFVVWRRRRALPNDIDVTALAEEAGADAEGGFAIGGDSYEAPAETFQSERPSPPRGGFGAAPAAGPGLFDDEDFEKESEMDSGNPSLPIERGRAEAPTQFAGGGADIARLVRDLERRVAQLEARLDESTEARERLERQVATQAEELRVQRVAIARTQRALRGLNRSDEEQATEPALREPK